jgi:myosin heavy subunit
LGNIQFRPRDGGAAEDQAEIVDMEAVNKTARQFGVDPNLLKEGLIYPRITVGQNERVRKQTDAVQASRARDALAKALYGRFFLWIVDKINETLKVKPKDLFIGLLDIAGFEIFKFNSFEQLCINFTNERLQQFFNNHMFKLEQEEYAREGIEWTFVDFGVDSQMTIDLLSKVSSPS